MPLHGYTRMFERMLAHPNIKVLLNTDFREIRSELAIPQTIYTGPVDAYFGYAFGRLPYRSLEFRHETHEVEHFQSVGTVNFPNEHAYTRVTEFKHLTGQVHAHTSIVYEYPRADGDPYYPIPRPENELLYKKYAEHAAHEPGVRFAGRLGTYRYYNMDQVVAQALKLYREVAEEDRAAATGNAA
jgi:UDP-galactopyranose mutase